MSPQNLAWRDFTTFWSNWNALARKSGLIGGSDPKTALAMVMTPGFWLLRPAKATALVFPILNWKWMRPTGNTNTSPLFRTLVKSLLSGFDVTKPTKRVPSWTNRISVARGWVWGGFWPYGAKSMRAKDTPRVFSPAIWATFTCVTLEPMGLDVSLGMLSPEKKKSFGVASFGSLQNFPFTNTARKKQILVI